MPRLNKMVNGKLYEDSFDLPILGQSYTLSSSNPDRISLTERPGYLRLKHGADTFMVLLDIPNQDFIAEIRNDYIPKIDSDTAGLVVWRSVEDYLELLEWFDVAQGSTITYPYMRIEKNGIVYDGYGSQDGTLWELIGSVKFEGAGKVGVLINGEQEIESVPFDVDYIKVFRNKYLEITNLPEGYTAQLMDELGNVLFSQTVPAGENGARVDLTNIMFPFQAKVSILTSENSYALITEMMEICGGDVYYYGELLDIYRIDEGGEVKISIADDTLLGKMQSGNISQRFRIYNPTFSQFYGVVMQVRPYDYTFGYEWVTLALEGEDGLPEGYAPYLEIGTIEPFESKYFYVKVTRDMNHSIASIDPYRFILLLIND